MDDKEIRERYINEVLCNPNFDVILPYLKEIQAECLSSRLLSDREYFEWTQAKIIAWIVRSQNEIKKYKAQSEESTDQDEVEHWIEPTQLWKTVNRILRMIADGVAWRMLRFDRSVIRVLSESAGTGYIEYGEKPFCEELKGLGELTGFSIINDCTRCLRTGDITQVYIDEVGHQKVLLHEVKMGKDLFNKHTSKKRRKGDSLSSQTNRLLRAQWAIDQRVLHLSSGPVYLDWMDFPMPHFFTKLKKMIARARQNSHSTDIIDECISVSCFSFRDADKLNGSTKVTGQKKSQDRMIFFSSCDFLMEAGGEFLRNATPLTVLPFDVQDQMDLLSGHLEISVKFNVTALCSLLVKRGWSLQLHDIYANSDRDQEILKQRCESQDRFESPEFGEAFITVSRDDFNTELTFNHIALCGFGYYKTEMLLNFLEATYEEACKNKIPRRASVSFVQERNILR